MITIVGAGKVGASVASQLVTRGVDDLVLLDVIEGLPQGEALDLRHLAASYGHDLNLRGSNNYAEMRGSELVIVTAGFGRKPGQTRLDLLRQNASIVEGVVKEVEKHAPQAILLMVTNPLDAMTYLAYRVSGFPRERVFGMGGMLDSARYKAFLAQQLGLSAASLNVMVIGEHGEGMLPLPRYTTVNGIALATFLSAAQMADAVTATRKIAIEVIGLKGATTHGPGGAVARMVESIIYDKKELLPVSAYLTGEYGVRDLCIGVPAVLGRNGLERIVELELTPEERTVFQQGVTALREAIGSLTLPPPRARL